MSQLNEVVVVGYGRSNRRNLSSAVTSLKPEDLYLCNGDLIGNDSRRQDQYSWKQQDPNSPLTILSYYLLYRYMAIKDNNKTLAAVVKMMEQMKGFGDRVLNRQLINILEEPLYRKNFLLLHHFRLILKNYLSILICSEFAEAM